MVAGGIGFLFKAMQNIDCFRKLDYIDEAKPAMINADTNFLGSQANRVKWPPIIGI